ncbi:MAG: PAS domain S-box protein [Labilithrix sp.]|nr:PAS domain S-box protein [Labilithrix sp.]MCW5816026.1 PAS domain S-box protein [Labilithrix sp.]
MPGVSLEDYRLLVDSIADHAIVMLDPTGQVMSWNRGAERITGYPPDEIVGQPVARLYPAADVASGAPQRELAEAASLGRGEDEGWRVRKDGSQLWANVVVTALRRTDGSLQGYALVMRDLTARRNAEEELRRAEQRFHGLVDAVTDYAVFMLDRDGCVTTWNSGARKAKGYEEDEIVGRHFSTFYTEEDRAAGRPARLLETVTREGRVEDEGWRVRKDGTRFWANVIITTLRDGAGEIIGYAKVTRDLTERRKFEEELRRSEERFRLLVESVGDAIYMLDPDGRVTTWNQGAQRMKGYPSAEVLGRDFEVFFPPADRAAGKPRRVLEIALREGRFEDEGLRVRSDGTQFWANVVVTAIVDANGNHIGFSKVTRDLTASREAEEMQRRLVHEQAARVAAERVAKQAEEANRIKDEFLATVSHELRTPLNAIVGWAKMLRQRELDPTVARGVEVIDRNAEAQVKIVDDILDVARIITGKLRIEPKPIDLVTIAHEAIEVVRPSAHAKDITLTLEDGPGSCILVGDHERLRQVAWNLLSNAVKFTDKDGRVAVRVWQDGPQVAFSVSDTGRGIAPDFLPRVFDRFTQEEGSTTRRIGGLGLGLSLVRHIVELHGGTVSAESIGPGHGSTFTFVLPVRATVSVPPANPARSGSVRRSLLGELRVLVVDDDADARDLVRAVLESAGAHVTVASSAEEALAAVRDAAPHVLVSDIGMPEQDGYSLMRRLRAIEPALALPSIALTAYTRAEDRTKALAAGFTTHIGKPVNPEDLITAVANLTPFARPART